MIIIAREQRAKWYASRTIIPHPVISAPRYVRLIKSPRLIGVHPYIRMRIIKFTGAINLAAVVRCNCTFASRGIKFRRSPAWNLSRWRNSPGIDDLCETGTRRWSIRTFFFSSSGGYLLRNVHTQNAGFV